MKKVNKKNSTAKYKKEKTEQEKTEQEIQKEVDEKVLEIFSRATSEKGLTEDSVGSIMALEQEIELYRGLVENVLAGHMVASYIDPSKAPKNTLNVDKYVFSLTEKGKKYVESGFKK